MVRVVLAFFLIFIFSSTSEAKSRRRQKKVVLPATTITCGKACRESAELARTMDDVVAGRLVVCAYQDEKAIWVRKPNEPGECQKVVVPQGRERNRK
jgi:hypothetical protein